MTSLSDYEDLLAPARERFGDSFGVRTLQSMRDVAFAELFLMYFCALGVHMTKPVEGWIRRAAARCTSMGFTQLGRELALHASAEADHHLLMIADLRSLAARWNASYAPPVDADALLGQLPSAGVVVRRQSFWDRKRLKIRESLARLVCDVMRPADGAASGDWRLSVV